MNRLPSVKAFLRRPGGVDQYPAVHVEWQLHRKPELHAKDEHGRNVTVDLSPLGADALHKLFGAHFQREEVAPPGLFVRNWRRFFGWGYGMSTLESALFFLVGGTLFAVVMYQLCYRYTAMCDSLQDL